MKKLFSLFTMLALFGISANAGKVLLDFEDGVSVTGWTNSGFASKTTLGANSSSKSMTTNGQTAATFTSTVKFEDVSKVTFYVSKETTNTNQDAYFYIEGSTDGINWTIELAKSINLKTATKEVWSFEEHRLNTLFTGYIRIRYESSGTAKKLIDEVEITTGELKKDAGIKFIQDGVEINSVTGKYDEIIEIGIQKATTASLNIESSDESVAEYADGILYLYKEGTTTITVTSAENDSYYAGEAELFVKVLDPAKVILYLETFGDNGSSNTTYSAASCYTATASMFTDPSNTVASHYTGSGKVGKNSVGVSTGYEGASGLSAAWMDSDKAEGTYDEIVTVSKINVSGYENLVLTFGAGTNSSIKSGNWIKFKVIYSFDDGEEKEPEIFEINTTGWIGCTVPLVGNGKSLTVSFLHDTPSVTYAGRIDDIKVTGVPTETKHISAFKYASYVPTIDVTIPAETEVKAFYLTEDGTDADNGKATMTQIPAGTKVKAGTPMVIYKDVTAEEGEDVTFAYGANAGAIDGNILKAASATNVPVAGTDLIFGQVGGVVGFYDFASEYSVPEGTVYVEGSVVRPIGGLRIIIDDDATAITSANVEASKADGVYNLAGQKVSANFKGIVIKNGKKVVIK